MLTKQERAAIAERLNKCNDVCVYDLYKAVFGKEAQDITPYREDVDTILRRLIDLCDTSNMIELPVDKDGEVIQVGDTLYDNEGTKIKVCGFLLREADGKILLDINANNGFVVMSANGLTHKKPVTIALLNEQLRHVLDKGQMSAWSMAELCDIADDLEMLGDSDD